MATDLLVEAPRPVIERCFGALIPLQPVMWTSDGLLCAPRIAGEATSAAVDNCPLPVRAVPLAFSVWPDSAAAFVAGWYRRSNHHAPAPPGMRELVQVPGDGFGTAGHATTEMCLRALDVIPDTPAGAVDVGCGSGLLSQAWAHSRGLPVLAIDADPAAVRQTELSADAAGVGHLVHAERRTVDTVDAALVIGRTMFANLPARAHALLATRLTAPPRVAVLSGLRASQAEVVVSAYLALGMRRVRASRRDGFECHVLVHAPR